ncbi:MAG TPA: FtsQ-type POTRA domain-containing protein [Anaerolineales bacterium]|nr:FtsQ-type POTRA domain-containing protein [Anaerolineales bacterium]
MTVADPSIETPRTRAEHVRSRRGHIRQPAERAPRGPARSAPHHRRPRRVWELPIPAEVGAALRLPALPAFRVGARILSTAMMLVVAWALLSAFRGSEFRVEKASVSPTELLTESQIRSIADIDGRPVFLIDPPEVRGRLLAQPEIQSADVLLRWPNHVELRVAERRPMIEWDDDGQVWWLSADGVAFLKHGELGNLIRVTASEPSLDVERDPLAPVIEPEALWAAAALLAQVPEVDGLQYRPGHGFGFIDPNGWQAYFGTGGDMVLKVQLYRRISEVLAQRGVVAELVSVEDPAAPYYRKK